MDIKKNNNSVNDKTHKSNKITILLIQPEKRPQVIETEDSLEELQELVGGKIHCIYPFEDDVALICSDADKSNPLQLNRALYSPNKKEITDIIAGNFLIAYSPQNSDNFESLSPYLIEKYSNIFEKPELFLQFDNQIKAIPIENLFIEKENAPSINIVPPKQHQIEFNS